MTTIDWAGLLKVGLHELRLPPEQFWRLTPVELRIMLGVDRIAPALTRARLEELSAAFPDIGKGDENDGCDRTDRADRGS
jgi:uncharacterized phage protein (TIGR02216 family)